MSTATTLARHLCYALIAAALVTPSLGQNPTAPVPATAPTPVAAAPDPTKGVNFRAAGTTLSTESASGEATTTTTTAPAGVSLIERRDALEAEIRASRSRMETTRRRAEVLN